ncbi:anthranilate synthase family protein [Streptomyces sp. WI04-05B]|uniref:anthranilate synthase family protein n=1 Tax=Streptomyces TaxID=1883 RepID=UPI0029AF9160|nr:MULTISPECIES: anthranilate synthase family protein [unclassified Streptomyces]MDX2541370.1 anthranilate synthase family protein [Streptomyces sp. WI04-05B]MDX2585400.1 anthranilate synthase family protein [Streptomyces sp. WI04-05A]MDX3751460.1 anthranilate synthase family protein [Streptomyces sp. AK08-02]
MRLDRLPHDDRPFALLRRRTPGHDHDVVELLLGPVTTYDRLADIPDEGLALIPFRQIRERGFDVRDDGTPLSVLTPEERYEIPLAEALSQLPAHDVRVEGGGFDVGDEEYAEIVGRVLREEIGRGEGANFVIRRTYEGEIPGFGRADALALFRRLLVGERGAYWTFVVHDGERTLVGASPEVHVRMSGGTVVMNPISGTYRYPAEGPTPEHLLSFLADGKEIEELSMVVDEELKMMCTVGDMGGVVVGPRLKEMAHLAHTEYELRGRSSLDVREVLKETMFAATVTGSPVQNACRVIERHEVGGRGYYAGALALVGRDSGGGREGAVGAQTLDSPILIRTADISADGRLRVPVGATLVRGSDPAGEVAETHAKAAGVLAALGVVPGRAREEGVRPRLMDDARVRAALDGRRASLAPFWLRMQERTRELTGHALVVDAEDTFTAMLAHVLRSSGLDVTVRRYDEPGLRDAVVRHEGPLVLGPGPGDPGDLADPKMRFLRELTTEVVRDHRHGVLGVCLGHELIAAELGLGIVRKEVPYQGAQTEIDLFGRAETVGFYNSFVAYCDDEAAGGLAAREVEVSRSASGEVHALRGPGFAGVQFHPESVLTLNGASVVRELVAEVQSLRAR